MCLMKPESFNSEALRPQNARSFWANSWNDKFPLSVLKMVTSIPWIGGSYIRESACNEHYKWRQSSLPQTSGREEFKGRGRRLCIRTNHQEQIPKVSASCFPKIIISYSGVSQPQHYWHLGPDNSLLSGGVLSITGGLAVSLVPTHWKPVAYHTR